jgi:hypothetical protein
MRLLMSGGHMNKEQFLVEPERRWFLEPTNNHQINQLRADIGVSFGWTDPDWYANDENLRQFLDVIEQNASRDQLLYELKNAFHSDEKKTTWLKSVTRNSLTSPQGSPTGAAAPSSAKSESTASAGQTAAKRPPTEKPKGSAFKKTPPGNSGAETASPGSATPTGTSQPGSPPKQSIFKTAKTETAAPEAQTPADVTEVLQQLQSEVQRALSQLSDDDLSVVAGESGVSPEEFKAMVQNPEFAQMVAEERVKLALQGG